MLACTSSYRTIQIRALHSKWLKLLYTFQIPMDVKLTLNNNLINVAIFRIQLIDHNAMGSTQKRVGSFFQTVWPMFYLNLVSVSQFELEHRQANNHFRRWSEQQQFSIHSIHVVRPNGAHIKADRQMHDNYHRAVIELFALALLTLAKRPRWYLAWFWLSWNAPR